MVRSLETTGLEVSFILQTSDAWGIAIIIYQYKEKIVKIAEKHNFMYVFPPKTCIFITSLYLFKSTS